MVVVFGYPGSRLLSWPGTDIFAAASCFQIKVCNTMAGVFGSQEELHLAFKSR